MDEVIARWRLRNQHLTAPHAGCASDVLDTLLAVQAENPSQSAWAVAARTVEPDAADLDALLGSGAVMRTHVLRPTWHYVLRANLDWLLMLTAPRISKAVDKQLFDGSDLSVHHVDRLTQVVLDLLGTTPHRTRADVAAAVRAGVPECAERVTGRVVMLLMAHLEMNRLVVSGAPRDGEHTYTTYADRVGTRVDRTAFDREEALARLAVGYFTGHGPATVSDLAYWATLPLTDVRRGLDAVRDHLHSFEHDGRTFWHAPGSAPEDPGPAGHLLQVFDETYRGYQDSRWVLDARGLVPRDRLSAVGMALVDGQLVASMKRSVTPSAVRFDLAPYRPLTAKQRRALDAAATRYGTFLHRRGGIVLTA